MDLVTRLWTYHSDLTIEAANEIRRLEKLLGEAARVLVDHGYTVEAAELLSEQHK